MKGSGDNVTPILGYVESPRHSGGEPPMSTLEQRVTHLEKDVAILRQTAATKDDLHQLQEKMHMLFREQTRYTLTIVLSVVGIFSGLIIAAIKFA